MGSERFDLVAHSMGAYYGGHYAMRYPERVRRLALVSPAGLGAHPPAEVVKSPPLVIRCCWEIGCLNYNVRREGEWGGKKPANHGPISAIDHDPSPLTQPR